ncbi:uncharacterized protein LOC127263434 [Andrographis paniculata]|uniref:uncharacterized protein LOC127263434 n=1 Tax=Andrographis paniculata TaxID=175694 RepID=UPI0021E9143E|nr:uncharacterized protein LOC127263434 [Andrographis paniculata]XP_051148404.1 uncharacterized protein LOC127263434 [Andrographis paniculata]
MEDDKSFSESVNHVDDSSHGWQKVTYAKKQRKNQNKKPPADSSRPLPGGSGPLPDNNGVFKGLEKHAEERRRKLEAQRVAVVYADDDAIPVRSRKNRGEDVDSDDESTDGDVKTNAVDVNKTEKPKKVKKPKITVSEAAAKIDVDNLAAFLSSITLDSYEGQQDIQLMRFADYFGRAFSAVSASQFPWLKLFRESPVAKISDVPVSYISETVYKTSVDWINQRSNEALVTFVIWSLDGILADLATQLSGSKGSKKGGQPTTSKSQVAIFLVLAMVLRRKPDVLINVFPKLDNNQKYQGQDKLPVIVWMVVQACHGDLAVGLLLWAHHILPILRGKSGSNPQSRDMVLQLAERIVGVPKARGILVSNAVRKGERLIPPPALDLLLHFTFPPSSGRVKATERFEAIYPLLKEVALAGSVGSKAMKQISLQIQTIAVKSAGEGIPALSDEATGIFIWCLTQNPECFKQWDKIYTDNIQASASILRKLSDNWKELSPKLSSLQSLSEALKSFRQKNDKALSDETDSAHQSQFKEADKYCKALLGRLSSSHSCLKTIIFVLAMVAVGAAIVPSNLDSLDLNKVSAWFNSLQSV